MQHEAESLYKPTQHLCDLIREAGYEGIAYRSAMGHGSNLVLFDPSAGEPFDVTYVRVRELRFDYSPIPAAAEIYEEGRFDHLVRKTNDLNPADSDSGEPRSVP